MSKEETTGFEGEPARVIEEFIKNAVAESPENRLFLIDDSPIFEEPLVGFADGDDPLFCEYKKIIGPFHLTPREILERSLSIAPNSPGTEIGNLSVVCWALPIAKKTRASNSRRDTWPSLRWSHTRYYGQRFIESLKQELVSFLARKGCLSVAPTLLPFWSRLPNYPGGPTSNWSERHALYVAGMGTFGLSDGFITPRGKAMRCGSVVVNLGLPPMPRKYRSHVENCPFYADRSCGVCIDRCPAGAITGRGHNKVQCQNYVQEIGGNLRPRYGVEIVGCGLCQTAVPCESRIPPR
ncbi:epoxyqueuosine reductase [Chloroflexota bacterium]